MSVRTQTAPRPRHPLAEKTVRLNLKSPPFQVLEDGALFVVKDWWQNVNGGRSWMDSKGNHASITYGIRCGVGDLPVDDEVVYGHIEHPDGGQRGYIVHASELGDEVDPTSFGGEHCPKCGFRHDGDCPRTISEEEAVAKLPDGDEILTVRMLGPLVVGMSEPRADILEALHKADAIYVPGRSARNAKCGLAIVDEVGLVFIETKPAGPPVPSVRIKPDTIEKGA